MRLCARSGRRAASRPTSRSPSGRCSRRRPAPTFEQRWTAWGASFGGYNKTRGEPTVGWNDVIARDLRLCGGHGLSRHARHACRLRARRRRHRLGPGARAWAAAAAMRSRPASTARALSVRPISPAALAFAKHWMTTNRTAFAGDQLTASFNAQGFGARVETGYRYARAPPDRSASRPMRPCRRRAFHTPAYSETDVDRRRLRARLRRHDRDRHPRRARRALRPCDHVRRPCR